jgi:hypothetical protein
MSQTLSELLAEARNSPEYRRGYEEMRTARQLRCAYGNCTHFVSRFTNQVIGGFGPVGCACEYTPGWKSPYLAGKSKPGWTGKARGRNGSRIQRSRRRHQGVRPDGFMVWVKEFAE